MHYDERAYPDFKPYSRIEVKVEELTGNRYLDIKKADEMARKLDPNFIRNPITETWHHHQDKTTMQRVPKDLHKALPHTGGMSTTKHGVNTK